MKVSYDNLLIAFVTSVGPILQLYLFCSSYDTYFRSFACIPLSVIFFGCFQLATREFLPKGYGFHPSRISTTF